MHINNLLGKTFGKVTVISGPDSKIINGVKRVFWTCVCECGKIVSLYASHIKRNSCSCEECLKATRISNGKKNNLRHGMRHTRTYKIWIGMKNRCKNPKNYSYHYYGGNGITISKEWENFENFISDMGPAPDKKTLDRIDNSVGYCKENCRWVTQKEQVHNSSLVKDLTLDNETHCIAEWAKILGISRSAISRRLSKGYSIEQVLSVARVISKTVSAG